MALVTPVLFLIIFGFVQLGYAYMLQHVLQNAAREACRIAAMPKTTNSDVDAIIATSLEAGGIQKYTRKILVNNVEADVLSAAANSDVCVQIQITASDATLLPGNVYFQYLTGPLLGSCSLRHE
jgi:Flp pilus assembly protein TadG